MKTGFRVSCYELLYPFPHRPEFFAAVNGLYGAYDVITAEEAGILEKAREKPSMLAALAPETRNRLSHRGHLVSESPEEERENVRIMSRIYWLMAYQGSTDLVILPTYNCNFRCEYCFERARLEKGSSWLSRTMTSGMADAIFRQMEAYQKRGIRLKRCFLYGGEPLLQTNREIVSEIIGHAERLGMKLACVTNGYELDHFIDLLKDHSFSFLQITVDGVGETHDARRYLAGGQGTYERIMDNISLALHNGISVHLRINVNRSNLESAMHLPEAFRERGFMDQPGFHYYFKATTACFEDDPANAITEQELFRMLCDSGIVTPEDVSHSRVYYDMASRVMRALKKETYPPLSPAHCGAESNMLVVDPEGVIYACWDLVSMEEHAIGFTDEASGRFLFNFDFSKWRTRTVDNMQECAVCPYLMVCGGGCATESLYGYGDMRKGTCGSVREAFDYAASRICEKRFGHDGERIQSLSLYDLFDGLSPEERQTLSETIDTEVCKRILRSRLKASDHYFG